VEASEDPVGRRSMAHVPLLTRPRGLLRRYAWRYSRGKFGSVVEPVRAAAHHGGVLVAAGAIEMAAERGWRKVDPQLRHLVLHAVSVAIGCSWCIDYGYYEGFQHGTEPVKLREVTRWRDSNVFDDRERVVLEYAEAATGTPAAVSADLVERLHRHFSDAELVELAAWIALENYRSRFNAALGLRSEGFAATCQAPATVVEG
jgi:AhpD family alkylhydroperoxidase